LTEGNEGNEEKISMTGVVVSVSWREGDGGDCGNVGAGVSTAGGATLASCDSTASIRNTIFTCFGSPVF